MRHFLLALSVFLCGSCSIQTAMRGFEKIGKAFDGTSFQYKTNSTWKAMWPGNLIVREITYKDGSKGVVVRSDDIPYLTFYGGEPDSKGVFPLTKAYFLAGNYGGWQEFDIEIEGHGRIKDFGNGFLDFTIPDNVKFDSIIDGKIRRDATRLSGEQALKELRARMERIDYLVNWMKESNDSKTMTFKDQADFEKYWRGILFAKRGAGQSKLAKTLSGIVFGKRGAGAGQDVELPAELEALIKNGALRADWDEAASWIWTFYYWPDLNLILNKEIVMQKV